MSFRKRLFNIAKAEVHDAARRLEGLFADQPRDDFQWSTVESYEAEPTALDEAAELRHEPPEIRRFYANLELPVGAPADEVKAAYRRLLRRYHPDLHATDPRKQAAATELSLRLREAYEGLLKHLGE